MLYKCYTVMIQVYFLYTMPAVVLFCSLKHANLTYILGVQNIKMMIFRQGVQLLGILMVSIYNTWNINVGTRQSLSRHTLFVNKSQKTQSTFWGSVENQVSTSRSYKYTSNANVNKTNTRDGPLGSSNFT